MLRVNRIVERRAAQMGVLTPRWSGRVKHKVPSHNVGARAAQINR